MHHETLHSQRHVCVLRVPCLLASEDAHRMTGSSMPACTAWARARSSALSDRRRLTWGRITYHLPGHRGEGVGG